ncbi:MAG: glycosyltransferase family 1 protein [Oscillospiraceae bacterium]
MKVAYFTDTFYPEINGVTNTLNNLMAYLKRTGIEYLVFAPDYNSKRGDFEECVMRFKGLPPFVNPNSRLALPNYRTVRNAILEFDPDIIHITIELGIGLVGLRVARELNIPIIMSYHTNFDSYLSLYEFGHLKKGYWGYIKWFHSFAKANLCPSYDTLKIVEKQGFQNLGIWSRGIDTSLFSPEFYSDEVRNRLGGREKTIFLYVGRIAREKGLDDLAEAIRIINVKHKEEAVFVFTGDGPYMKELKEMNLPNAVFTGFLQRKELAEVYASGDIFVFPSGTETFGNVILEAMSSGLPVVCTDSGGITDVTSHLENSYVCKYRHAESLAGGMKALLNSPELRSKLRRGGLETAATRSWDYINDELINQYETVLGKSVGIKSLAG